MDQFDAIILTAIQRNNRLTADALSEQVGLSPDACRKRLGRLRAEGYVEQDIAILNPDKLGRDLMIITEVTLERERRTDIQHFSQRMRDAPEVMQCYYVTGDADFVLILSVRDMAGYKAFTNRHFFLESNVARFRTTMVMDRVKMGFAMPIGDNGTVLDGTGGG